MSWNSTADFFHMGGYGLYVWGSYAVAALVFAVEPWLAARRRKRAQAALLSPPTESDS
ncbi:MAG TPA: heme exporter protein CcmD [Rhizobacter sp.]|nr:heme exporter protein CcmD [Rhizobacter sp.]